MADVSHRVCALEQECIANNSAGEMGTLDVGIQVKEAHGDQCTLTVEKALPVDCSGEKMCFAAFLMWNQVMKRGKQQNGDPAAK